MNTLILAGLLAALCYGVSDYVGGQASARIAIAQVLVIGEFAGALVLWLIAWYVRDAGIAPQAGILAMVAGILGAVGVAFLYRGIARGYTAVTAPVSAVISALVPVIYGITSHGVPTARVISGIGLGVIAIVLTSWTGQVRRADGLWQGLMAGCMFGLYFVLIKIIGRPDALVTPLAISRSAALLVSIPWWLLRPAPRPSRDGVGLALLAGMCDVGAGGAFMVAALAGRIDIAGVLASLYPAVTVLLAFFINHERIMPPQRWGLVLTIMATALIAL